MSYLDFAGYSPSQYRDPKSGRWEPFGHVKATDLVSGHGPAMPFVRRSVGTVSGSPADDAHHVTLNGETIGKLEPVDTPKGKYHRLMMKHFDKPKYYRKFEDAYLATQQHKPPGASIERQGGEPVSQADASEVISMNFPTRGGGDPRSNPANYESYMAFMFDDAPADSGGGDGEMFCAACKKNYCMAGKAEKKCPTCGGAMVAKKGEPVNYEGSEPEGLESHPAIDRAIESAKKGFYGKPTADQVERHARGHYFNDSSIKKSANFGRVKINSGEFKDHKHFGSVVRSVFEKRGGK